MMAEAVEFDRNTGRFTFLTADGPVSAAPKYSDFLCILIALPPEQFLDRAQLARFDSWAGNQPLSAGKQVSRFLARLEAAGVSPVTSEHRTNRWRLSDVFRASLSGEVSEAAVAHVAGRLEQIHMGSADGLSALLNWYHDNFEALVAMTTGRAREGHKILRQSMKSTADEQLLSISNMLITRIEQRIGEPRLPILSSIKPPGDAFARAVEIRRSAAYALYTRMDEWPQLEATFRRQLAQLAGTGDFTSIAIVRNALGVLCKRMGRLDDARDELAQAAPFAIFSGDLILIQNIAFNLANIASEIERDNPSFVAKDDFLKILEFDVGLRRSMSLGRDSAQTELLLAHLMYEARRYDDAQKYLDIARDIIDAMRLPNDEALYARTRGLLIAARDPEDRAARRKAIALLSESATIYAREGYLTAARHVANERRKLENGNVL